MASTAATAGDEEHNTKDTREQEENAPDEDTGGHVSPIVKLEEVAVLTGEEDEDPILDMKAKLYRFDKEGKQWKERGVGNVKLLKHKESGKVRLVMRQSKTLKICANHIVGPTMNLQEHHGNDKSCIWHAADFADGELKDELFCIRFASVDNCKTFMETVKEVAETQEKKEERKEAEDAAGLLEKLSVGDDKKEQKDKGDEVHIETKGAEAEKTKPDAENEDRPASSE